MSYHRFGERFEFAEYSTKGVNLTAVYLNLGGNSTGSELPDSLSHNRNQIWPFSQPGTIIPTRLCSDMDSRKFHTQAQQKWILNLKLQRYSLWPCMQRLPSVWLREAFVSVAMAGASGSFTLFNDFTAA
mgnify:CR=1 FL=1|jgi:hypothetical protein